MLILLCFASRRGLGLSEFMTDVRLLINDLLKVATLTHIWVDEAPGYSSNCLSRHLGIPGLPVFLWTATQAQRDHEIIHTRNFRVQPQAIMGSSIVE